MENREGARGGYLQKKGRGMKKEGKSAAREKPSSLKNVCEKRPKSSRIVWPAVRVCDVSVRCVCACVWNAERVLAK